MAFRHEELTWLVTESSTLSERLAGSVAPGGSGRATGAAGRRLGKWRDHVANGDAVRFERRLRWDALDHDSALALLGPVRLPDASVLPDWARLLDAATRTSTGGDTPPHATAPREIFDPNDPQPFEDVIWPLIPETERRLVEALGSRRRRLGHSALLDLARGLLKQLCHTAARTLCAEFEAFRAARTGHVRSARGGPRPPGRQLYRDFVREMAEDRAVSWMLRYPMLARLLATRCQLWIETTVELVRRLDEDAPAIRTAFDVQDRTLVVVGAEPGLSDPHCRGRTVCVLRFGSGAKLVYKPRPLALERHFSEVLETLGRAGCALMTKRPAVLDRGDHGWVEAVHTAPCADRAALERFYRRAGMLTCLAYVLGGSDLHGDNLIASGEHPVLVDLECIVGAPLATRRSAGDTHPAHDASPAGTVLRTGLTPSAQRGVGGAFRLAGGLADPSPRHTDGHPIKHVNTDWMTWQNAGASCAGRMNAPTLDGRTESPSADVDLIAEGFREMYVALRRERRQLAASGPIRQLERAEFRVVIRATRTYAVLLQRALAPQHLTSGADWSIALDVLAAPALRSPDRPAGWATRTAERRELEQLDIPVFRGRMDQPALRTSSGTPLDEVLDRTGYLASTRLARLNIEDLNQQLRLLRMSFTIADAKKHHRERRADAAGHRGHGVTRRQAVAEARAILDLLRRLAIDEGDATTWYGFDRTCGSSPTLSPVGVSLYSGTSGIGLFLAAASALTGSREARDLTLRAIDPLCTLLGNHERRRTVALEIGIGGGLGLGGLVYALVRAGESLGAPHYLDAARGAAEAITRTAIQADDTLDVMSGTAGAMLGLLALYRATGDRPSLQRAVWCGEHLLDSRTTDPDSSLQSWRARRGLATPGFAHGAGGMACALQRLFGATGEVEYRRAASEAWSFERSLLPPGRASSLENAPSSHDPPADRTWSWCHGWPGFGLARLGALDDRCVRADVEAALSAAPRDRGVESDSLCCGRLGRADLLLSAGLRLNRRQLCDAALTLGGQTVARALLEGRYATGADDGFRPGLFQGLSGIGYELLRMQAPATIPSVLLWE